MCSPNGDASGTQEDFRITNTPQGGDHTIDYSTWLPLDEGANQGGVTRPATLGGSFGYVGRGLTAQEFTDYLQGTSAHAPYDFGPIPPDFIVLHHTAVPTLAD